MHTADHYITGLQMEEHIEGGYYKEVYKNPYSLDTQTLAAANTQGERVLSSTIYYLLKSGQVSQFHRLNFDEVWFYHDGSPIQIHMIDPNGTLKSLTLGLAVGSGETPQVLVPAGSIFAAEVLQGNSFSLVSCVVSPGFDDRDFQIYTGEELTNLFPQHRAMIEKFSQPMPKV